MNEKQDINQNTPIYKHDCNNCQFLGYFEHEHYGTVDLYFCNHTPTVVARYGHDGWEYMSGMIFANPDGNAALYEAKLRAIKLGIYEEKNK